MDKVLKLAAKIVSDSECFSLMLLVEKAVIVTQHNVNLGHCLESEALDFFKRKLFTLQNKAA